MTDSLTQRRIEITTEYFRRVDRADPTILELFTDDATMYFPKLGVARGKAQIGAFAQGFGAEITSIEHDIDNFLYIPYWNYVVVEGQEKGTTQSGGAWPKGAFSQGRFCNVFEFSGTLISRVHIYTDPDFNSADAPRVNWAKAVHDGLVAG